MARVAASVTCSDSDRKELERLSASRTEQARLVERAKIVLGCLAGERNDQIATRMKLQANTVATWRKRFLHGGIKALGDRARSGKPPTYVARDLRERIRKKLELPPPDGLSSWDGGTLAQALGVSDDAIWRILRKEGIQLRRMRSWCVSTDPEFAAKAADVIGLYLGPPTNALVLSVDEKPSIQALERKTGYVHTSSGKIVRGIKSTYKRHGTINLFAALNVATGAIHSKVTTVKKRPDFQAFLDDVVAEVPVSQEVHVILDNYATHKRNDDWLALHPNVHFHFTPTSASWLNQVEIWFGIFTRKSLSGASFQSTEQLTQAIEAFVTRYNETAAPFVWRKREVRGAQLRNTIVNLRN
ncbi:IS630 family transposase [Rhodoferax ferrireducens]|uniref:IS630 family transposase n=1 Tax=Rhodoferax ferrireducens TaxID=192843 RepID=UPI003BB6224A